MAYRTWLVVAAWFALNITMGNLNGWILKHHGFAYPAALTMVHMVVGWAMSIPCLLWWMRPENPRPASPQLARKVQTLAFVFCASVACGNIALRFIFVSFSQMVTAASPLFTMLLMTVMSEKRYSRLAYLSMIPMCGGVMLCTAGELNFHLLGFAAVVVSTVLRGVKSILQGKLLTSPEDKLDAMTLLYHMTRSSVLPLGGYAALFEYPALHDPQLQRGGGGTQL